MSIPPSATARQSRNCSLCDVPYELGEVYQLVYAFIRKGGKLPVYARWIEGSVTPTNVEAGRVGLAPEPTEMTPGEAGDQPGGTPLSFGPCTTITG
jgi:hypothetical protein